MDLIYITTHLNTHEKCVKYLEKQRWNGTPTCPYCKSQKSSSKGLRHTCLSCTNSYSVTVGTVFEDSNLPLYKWFMAIALILSAKKGISSLQLARDLSVNKNTAWLMQMKIRKAMQEKDHELLDGIVEADETFIGGKINSQFPPGRNQNRSSKLTERMQTVLGIVQREGRVLTKVIDKPSREEIMSLLKTFVTPQSILVTDSSYVYFPAKEYFKSHYTMSRGSKIFKRGIYHKNTIEGFFSQLKRAIIGQYHKLGARHLQLYADEVCFKYNHRNNPDKGYGYLMKKLINPI